MTHSSICVRAWRATLGMMLVTTAQLSARTVFPPRRPALTTLNRADDSTIGS